MDQSPLPEVNNIPPPIDRNPEEVLPVKPSFAKPILLMSVLIVLLLGTSAFLYYQNTNLQKQISALQGSPLASSTPNPTTNWKTYINQDLGFSFKYPDDIFSHEDVSEKYMLSWANKAIDGLEDIDNDTIWMNLYIYTKFDANELSKYTADNWTISYLPLKGALAEHSFTASYLSGKVVYVLSMNSKTDETLSKYGNIFSQILSTFKFLDESGKLNDSKYACPANGWVNCMPGPDMPREECSQDAMDWYEENCPDFQGSAV